MSTLQYWLWLATRAGLRTGEAAALAGQFGTPEAAYFADPAEYDLLRLPGALRESLRDKSMEGVEAIFARCERLGVRVLTLQDAQYPERLRQLHDRPAVLYLKGREMALDREAAIGVVGARRCTPYGVDLSRRLGQDLARRGAVLVSGIAQGVDAAALRGALSAGGRVISVLGGGIDVVYPPSSADLFEEIAVRGLLVSEYPPGTPTAGAHYPVRNRIISGLSVGVAVVEAGERSGALITARLALDQNRDVFAFPGPVGAPMSVGPNRLIQRGEAKPVFGVDDILEEYENLYPAVRPSKPPVSAPRNSRPAPPRREPVSPPAEGNGKQEMVDKAPGRAYSTFETYPGGASFSDDEKAVLLALGEDTLHPDELAEAAGIPARRVLSALTILEMRGVVRSAPGSRFAAAVVFRRRESPD